MQVLIDRVHGICIPQIFALRYDPSDFGLDQSFDIDFEILRSGPDHEEYWDSWGDICCEARKDDQILYSHPDTMDLLLATPEELDEAGL